MMESSISFDFAKILHLLKSTKRNTKRGGDPPNSLPESSSGKTA